LRAIGAQASLRGAQVSFGIDWPGPPAMGAQADRTVWPPAGIAHTTLGREHDVGRPPNNVEPALSRQKIGEVAAYVEPQGFVSMSSCCVARRFLLIADPTGLH
jgi:hypothetical protein